MRLVPLLSLLALSPLLAAQSGQTGSAVVLLAPTSQNCPVGLTASHAEAGGLISVRRSAKSPEQAYRLTFTPQSARGIAQVRITLHGLAGAQVVPAGNGSRDSRANASESFNLVPSSDADHLFHSTVYAGKITGVQWVELNQITYADGTSWHESETATCRVAPNGFMLVASGN